MRILAVDTATEVCGVALWEDERIAAEIRLNQGTTHTRVLMRSIQEVLEKAGSSIGELDAFVISQGPGSFTGLRIGIGTVKGLAAATGKPIVGISTLAVLAHQALDSSIPLVCPMIDARRGEVYWSVYRRSDNSLSALTPERASVPGDVRIEGEEACQLIGSGARLYASILQDRCPSKTISVDPGNNNPDPCVLARLGALRLHRGQTEDAHRFTPVYLRKSDAELTHSNRG